MPEGLTIEKMAEAISTIDSVQGLNTAIPKMLRATTTDMFIEAWINGLLSGPPTHMINSISNALNAVWQVPERYLASLIGRALPGEAAIRNTEAMHQAYGLIEGVKDGQRFMKVLKEVAAKKPVVIWKGGRSEEGERAISSHTGSLAVSNDIWDAAVRQCGAVSVSTMEELVDTIKGLLYFPPVRGKRVGIAGGSGGQSVAIADAFASAGLYSPVLTEESYRELGAFLTLIGGGYRNPIDTGSQPRNKIPQIMEVLDRDENIDNLVLLTGARWGMTETPKIDIETMAEIKQKSSKPVMAVVAYSTPEEMQGSMEAMMRFQEKGVPAFPSIERGAKALKNAFDYYSFKVE